MNPTKIPKCIFVLAILYLQIPREVHSARILAVEFFGSKSHVITYLPLLEELSRRGHSVTILGPGKDLIKDPSIRGIFTNDSDSFGKDSNITMFTMKEENMDVNPFTFLTQMLPRFCKELYNRPEIIELMSQEFDLILFQPLLNDCAVGFVSRIMANKNRPPLVLFAPAPVPNFLVEMIGGHHPSSYVANPFLGFRDEMTFLERFVNTGVNFVLQTVLSFYYIPAMERIYKNILGQETPSVKEVLGSASLLLSNGHFSVSGPRPHLPDVVDVGGIHSRDAQELPEDLEQFISRGKHGFILFSLGTGLRSDQMSEQKRNIFVNVFSKLEQQVVWKYESDSFPDVPKNVYLGKWLPQQDLLGHGKVKLFITHCGMGGTEEAIYHGVPLLGIPFFGDQPMNAKEAETRGYLYKMDWNELTEEGLMKGIKEVLNNPKYRDNVKRISKVFKDQIDRPLDRGVWWMEYVLRHNGAPQLQSAGRKLNYFQYHSLDVFAAYLSLVLITVYLIVNILKYIWNVLCGKSNNEFKGGNGSLRGIKNGKKSN